VEDLNAKAGQAVLLEDLVRTENLFCAAFAKLKRELQASIQVTYLSPLRLLCNGDCCTVKKDSK
jgi:hypothetical protein